MVYFAVVTDIHYGFDRGNKKGSQAPKLVDRFVRTANRNGVDFAVDLGDRVIATDPETDHYWHRKLTEQFNALAVPRYAVDGNHDVCHMAPNPSRVERHGDFTLIMWNPDVAIRKVPDTGNPAAPARVRGLNARTEDLQWLKNALAAAETPCIVFSHVPLDNTDKDDRHALQRDGHPSFSYYPQGGAIRKILEESGKVDLCLAGHRHRNRHRAIEGIHYLTLQSLVQRNENTGHVRGAFYTVKIDDGTIAVKGYGPGQRSYKLDRRDKGPSSAPAL